MSDEAGDKVTEPSSSGGDGGAEDANKSEGSPAAEPEASEKSSEDDQSDEEQDEDYGPFGDHGGIWASDTDVGHIWVTSKGKKLKFTITAKGHMPVIPDIKDEPYFKRSSCVKNTAIDIREQIHDEELSNADKVKIATKASEYVRWPNGDHSKLGGGKDGRSFWGDMSSKGQNGILDSICDSFPQGLERSKWMDSVDYPKNSDYCSGLHPGHPRYVKGNPDPQFNGQASSKKTKKSESTKRNNVAASLSPPSGKKPGKKPRRSTQSAHSRPRTSINRRTSALGSSRAGISPATPTLFDTLQGSSNASASDLAESVIQSTIRYLSPAALSRLATQIASLNNTPPRRRARRQSPVDPGFDESEQDDDIDTTRSRAPASTSTLPRPSGLLRITTSRTPRNQLRAGPALRSSQSLAAIPASLQNIARQNSNLFTTPQSLQNNPSIPNRNPQPTNSPYPVASVVQHAQSAFQAQPTAPSPAPTMPPLMIHPDLQSIFPTIRDHWTGRIAQAGGQWVVAAGRDQNADAVEELEAEIRDLIRAAEAQNSSMSRGFDRPS